MMLLDPTTVAARLGVKIGTLAKIRVRGGGPPFVKIGARVMYDEKDLDAWLDAQPRHDSTSDLHTTTWKPRGPKNRGAVESTFSEMRVDRIALMRGACIDVSDAIIEDDRDRITITERMRSVANGVSIEIEPDGIKLSIADADDDIFLMLPLRGFLYDAADDMTPGADGQDADWTDLELFSRDLQSIADEITRRVQTRDVSGCQHAYASRGLG